MKQTECTRKFNNKGVDSTATVKIYPRGVWINESQSRHGEEEVFELRNFRGRIWVLSMAQKNDNIFGENQ